MRGAVIMGLARSDPRLTSIGLVSRAARKHYGVDLSVSFNAGKHEDSRK